MAIRPAAVIVATMLANPAPAVAPQIHRACESVAVWRSQTDWTIQGPLFSVVQPDRRVTIDLGEGMEIRGKPPWLVQLCDGHLTIRRL